MEARDILIRPIVTEKIYRSDGTGQIYIPRTACCYKDPNPPGGGTDFQGKGTGCEYHAYEGKLKRMGRTQGRRSDWKKAVDYTQAG